MKRINWVLFKKEILLTILVFTIFAVSSLLIVLIGNGNWSLVLDTQFWLSLINSPFFYFMFLCSYIMVAFKRLSLGKKE